MHCYAELAEFLEQGKDKTSRPAENNTRVIRLDASTVGVRLHETIVIRFTGEGAITLDSGNWRTVTTKERMNAYLPMPWRVYSEKGQWRFYNMQTRESWGYADGLTVLPDGTVTGTLPPDKEREEKENRKAVKAYARGYVDALAKGQTDNDNPCEECVDHFDDGRIPDTAHLWGHIRAKEYPYTLSEYLTYTAHSPHLSSFARDTWYPYTLAGRIGEVDAWSSIAKRQYTRAIEQFLFAQFGLTR